MRNNNQLWMLSVIFIFALFTVLTPISVVANSEINHYETKIQEAIDRASEYMLNKEEGVISEWEAIGLSQAGKTVPESYEDWFYNNVESQITRGLDNGRIKITDIERLAIAAVALGKNPQNILDHNLIELIYNSPDRNGGFDTMTFQGNNGPIFALIALDTLNYPIPDNSRWTRQALIDELLSNQYEDGSWPLNEGFDVPNIDITAMAIIGLSPYKEQDKVRKAIEGAIDYLASVQTENGGFDGGSFVGGITSEAASQVIIGLTAYGIDPTSEQFTENDINLIDHLLSYQVDDGGFQHTEGDTSSNAMATEQALQALVAYQFYIQGKGALYDFTERDLNPEEPGNGSEEVTHVDIEEGESITIEVNKEKPVVINNGTKVTLPDDLPDNTLLTITKVENIPGDSPSAGDVYDFDFVYATEERPSKPFVLTMGVNEGVDETKVGIYYYNETTTAWEYVGGDVIDGAVTVEVDHFSTYGVFADVEGPINVQFSVENKDYTSVTLAFSATDFSGIDHFLLLRSGVEVAKISGSKTLYTDTNVVHGKSYEYELIAVDPLGNRSESSLLTVGIPSNQIEQPSKDDESEEERSEDEKSDEDKSIDSPMQNESNNDDSLMTENKDIHAESEDGKKLPTTATNMYMFLFIGSLLLVTGGTVFYIYKRKSYT